MTPKEKAKKLINMYYQKVADSSYPKHLAKQCALIAVDEIMDECTYWQGGENIDWEHERFDYWQQVKKYISYE